MKKKNENTKNEPKYAVAVLLRCDPYIYSEFFRLTLDEIKEKFDSWIRNEHQILRISITFNGDEYIRVKNYTDLIWVVKHKDDPLFEFSKDYRLRN